MLIGKEDGDVLATFPKPIDAAVTPAVVASVGIMLFRIEVVVFNADIAVAPTFAIEFTIVVEKSGLLAIAFDNSASVSR